LMPIRSQGEFAYPGMIMYGAVRRLVSMQHSGANAASGTRPSPLARRAPGTVLERAGELTLVAIPGALRDLGQRIPRALEEPTRRLDPAGAHECARRAL